MLVHFEVTFHTDSKVYATVLAYLFQHVVKESQSGRDVAMPIAIQIQGYVYICLLGSATYFRCTLTGKEEFGHLIPILGGEGTVIFKPVTSSTITFGNGFQ
jgi:hypothetical protein